MKSDLRSESFKGVFGKFIFAYNLMPGCSEKN